MIVRFLRTVRGYGGLMVHLLRIYCSVLHAIFKISKLSHSPVTIFGGARLTPDSIYSVKASQLAHKLADNGIPVLTGGGPGIMEAASCGATQVKKGTITTLGIRVSGLLGNEVPSPCQADVIVMNNYGARKWLLISYSIGFVVFPGGYGTLDELMELLTLIQTKLREKSPVILIGKDYWKPFLLWITDSALKNNLIEAQDIELFIVTDDIDEAFRILKEQSDKQEATL